MQFLHKLRILGTRFRRTILLVDSLRSRSLICPDLRGISCNSTRASLGTRLDLRLITCFLLHTFGGRRNTSNLHRRCISNYVIHGVNFLYILGRGTIACTDRTIEGQLSLFTSLKLRERSGRWNSRFKICPLQCEFEHLLVHLEGLFLLIEL